MILLHFTQIIEKKKKKMGNKNVDVLIYTVIINNGKLRKK